MLILSSQELRGPILAQQNDALACAGCSFSKMSSRLRGVSIFTITRRKPHFGEPSVSFDDVLSALDAALACAGCTFLPKAFVSPRQRAHSTYPRSEFTLQHQLDPLSASSPKFYFLRRRRLRPAFCAAFVILHRRRVSEHYGGWRGIYLASHMF